MKLLSVLLSVAGISGLVWVCPVVAETGEILRAGEAGEEMPLQLGNASDLLAQGVTRVTGVEVIQTEAGLELILETVAGSERLVPLILPEGNDLIIDILDATLAFSIRNGVTETNPAPGISQVTVNRVDDTSIRVTITGANQTPSAEVVPGRDDLVLSVTPQDTTVESEPDEEIEVIATGQAEEEGYNVDIGTAATRTDTPLQDVPQSIQVIPQEVIENREVNDFTDALENIPGIVSVGDPGIFNNVNIRGFRADFRRNGLRSRSFSSGEQTANVERIEVLKGPASVLYGQGSFGGTVNVITKQPTDEPFYKIDAAIGNFDLYRGAVDLSGPLNESKSLKYRLNLAAETENGFIDFNERDRFLIAPVLSWQIGKNTEITFEAEYSNLTYRTFFGLPARGTVLDNLNGEIEQDRFVGDPEENREADQIFVGYDLEHRFSENWRIRNAFQFRNRLAPGTFSFPTNLQEDDRTLEVNFSDAEKFDTYEFILDTYAVGNFNTGSIKHELVVGVELFRSELYSDVAFGDNGTLDLFAPDYDTIVSSPPDSFESEEIIDQNLGIYLQDKIEFTENLILLGGVRFDIANTDSTNFVDNTSNFQQEEEFSPRVGLVYKVIPEVSLYASYSRSFSPNIGSVSVDGELFAPERGTQYEIGAKAELNDRISLTIALFDITNSNVLTPDLDNPGFDVLTGERNSQGVELFAQGEILPGWNVIGGYTYNDVTVTEDNDIEVGNRINNVPEHAVSFLTTYEIQQGSLQGLGGSLGIYFVGDRQGDLENTFEVPSYTRTDASIFYNRDRFRAGLNFRNLFDIDYFENASNDLRVRYGAPFTVVGSVSYEF